MRPFLIHIGRAALLGAFIGAVAAALFTEGSQDGAIMGAIVGGVIGLYIGARMEMHQYQVVREQMHPEAPIRGRTLSSSGQRIIQDTYRGPLSGAAQGKSLSELETLTTEVSGFPAQVDLDDEEKAKL
ncbi:MAG: glycine zipper 2TM domain-containing protein [Chloroflexi bacterium]|nr:glycine zipper 2TM domain-containing protein [Chloroflexota bacterium]